MPEAGKATAQLAAEVAHVRKVRPDLPLVAVADAAPDNWTFLEKLRPDERAVDFFHAHLGEVADQQPTGTTSTAPSCATTKRAGRPGDLSSPGDRVGTQDSRSRACILP